MFWPGSKSAARAVAGLNPFFIREYVLAFHPRAWPSRSCLNPFFIREYVLAGWTIDKANARVS